jgi:heat-inducible transcriptional repressor
VGPNHESATVRSVQLVGLGSGLALVVVVLSDGAVDKRTVELEGDVRDEDLAAATGHVQAHVRGQHLADVTASTVPDHGDPEVRRLTAVALSAIVDMGRDADPDQVFVGGPSQLAGSFEAVETVRSVLSILEHQLVMVSLLRDVLDRGLSVAIGTEHGYEPLASCAVVVAPLSVDGVDVGAIGLLGPTRMDYPHALAAAHVVGERLGERIIRPGKGVDHGR